jgi:hypothetical protein
MTLEEAVLTACVVLVGSILSFGFWIRGEVASIKTELKGLHDHCDNQKEACHQRLERLERIANGNLK